MNIKTRIHRIELSMRTGGAFCHCPHVNKFEIWRADLSAASNTSEPHLHGAPVPDVCLSCGKSIEKEVLILQGVDHATKTRFPAEWNAAREN